MKILIDTGNITDQILKYLLNLFLIYFWWTEEELKQFDKYTVYRSHLLPIVSLLTI